MRLAEIGPEDVDAVQELIESDPGYTERVTGYPPGPADAQSLLMGRPEGADEKVVLAVHDGDQLVAVVDLLRGYPNAHTGFIGLLEVHGAHQGKGVGRTAYELVEHFIAETWPEIRVLRLAVVDSNAKQAKGFWIRQGFETTGETKPYRYDKLESVARLYEKRLLWGDPDLMVKGSEIEGHEASGGSTR